MFDGSIGAQAVYLCHTVENIQMTETQAMVAKVPVQNGTTKTVTMMSYGFDPYLILLEPISWSYLRSNRVCCQNRCNRW